MPLFVKLAISVRKKFFKKIKLKINDSWEKFYPNYNISRAMFFNYLAGRYAIPKNLFLEWKQLIGGIIIPFAEKEAPRYLQKEIQEVIMDEKLSEIFGVLNGDGHLSKFNYEICIVGDLNEENYYCYLKNLFEKKFGISFTLRREKHCFKLRCYSKKISNLLNGTYGLPKGNKLGILRIPKKVFPSKNFLKAYIRGLYDTDGSFYIRRKKDPVISITSADSTFLKEVRGVLVSLGFFVAKGDQRIFIYQKEMIARFFKEIKPANSKHLKKYQNYLNLYMRE